MLAKGVIPKKKERKNERSRRGSPPQHQNNNGKNQAKKAPHPRHRNGNDVEHGKCPRCVAINGEDSVEVTEIESHHDIPRKYGGKNGPRRKLCPDCHAELHILYERYVTILAEQSWEGFSMISELFSSGQPVTEGDLTKIALDMLGRR